MYLNSFHGKVAAKPGENMPTQPGYVNFKQGVFYGTTQIRMPTALENMNNTEFGNKLTGLGIDKTKITIGYQTGNAKNVGR